MKDVLNIASTHAYNQYDWKDLMRNRDENQDFVSNMCQQLVFCIIDLFRSLSSEEVGEAIESLKNYKAYRIPKPGVI